MPFAGGPLNNFVLYSMVQLTELLRKDPSATGLLSTVSGMLTKQGFSLWSAQAPKTQFTYEDVTAAVTEATELCEVLEDYEGDAKIAAVTVLHGPDGERAVVIGDVANDKRVLACSTVAEIVSRCQTEELIGNAISVKGDGTFTL